MRRKVKVLIFQLLIIGVFLVFANGCDKDDNNNPSSDNKTNGKSTAVFNSNITYGKMTDQDGNVYKTVTIGTQTWMAENLRTTKYNDGTAIPNITGKDEWRNLTTGAYCNYNNTTSEDTIATYGRLYSWHVIKEGKIAPVGWHVPTKDEWLTLFNYMGDINDAGGNLKETGTIHWSIPNECATNQYGFTLISSGRRNYDGEFWGNGIYCALWSSDDYNEEWAEDAYEFSYSYCYAYAFNGLKNSGQAIRCIKD